MRRFVLYLSAAIIFASLITTAFTFTTLRVSAPLCPRCNASDAEAGAKFDTSTIYTCRTCRKTFYGPARRDFSWMDALEAWLDDEPMIQ